MNFSERRNKLFALMNDNSVALIYSGQSKIKSEDEFYPFWANRNFFYLTGIEQENSLLVMIKTPGQTKEFLFLDEYNAVKERWTGKKLQYDEASSISAIDNVYSNDTLNSMLEMIMLDKSGYGYIKNIYLDLSDEIKVDTNKSTLDMKVTFEEVYDDKEVKDVYPLICSLRKVKSKEEINALVEAINITNTGINDLLINLKYGIHEHELSDRFEYYGKTHGRRKLAFETICAAGKDATIMHHPITQQETQIADGDLVLFDLGYRYKGYCADISRCYPANGVFTEEQKKVYQVVLDTNKAVIEYAKPGLTIEKLQEYALDCLKIGAVKAGLIKKEDDIKKYYIHNVSHFLGLDTHDVGERKEPFIPGNVLTVEPGLYFVDRGIGVRIEDDIVITETGCECLSKGIVKEINDIEKLLRTRK